MKDDIISRAAALDALDRLEYTPGEWATNGLTMCKDVIKALPSAQPDVPDTNVGDTISRQAAIKTAHFPVMDDASYEVVRVDDILALPTVDVVPVRHGRWIRVYSRPGVFKYLGWTCDQCGQRTGNEYAPQWYKFCPNCGARMDGDDHGKT